MFETGKLVNVEVHKFSDKQYVIIALGNGLVRNRQSLTNHIPKPVMTQFTDASWSSQILLVLIEYPMRIAAMHIRMS